MANHMSMLYYFLAKAGIVLAQLRHAILGMNI
jgi:hypothetical protein